MRIKIKNLSKKFNNEKNVIENLCYEDDITSLAIIGPSGGGKSTLLRVLGGLINPTFGQVSIDGKEIIYEEEYLLNYRRNIGFVFQSKGLFHHLTAMENITVPLINVHGLSKKESQEIAVTLLNRFGLETHMNKYPSELSGGQQQRIAIARAVAPKPKLILLDEPTSALDPELTTEVLDMVNELKKDNLNIILVTHEMGFAKNACEKAIFLYDGKLLEYGQSKSLFLNPQTEELKKFLKKVLEWNA